MRAGRFLPAYGVRCADHTAFTRAPLRLDNEDQVYALELSYSGDRQLVQVSAGPGFADSVGHADERAFTATGALAVRPAAARRARRLRAVSRGLARSCRASGPPAWRSASRPSPGSPSGLQGDARLRDGAAGGTGYTLLADAAYEILPRGLAARSRRSC